MWISKRYQNAKLFTTLPSRHGRKHYRKISMKHGPMRNRLWQMLPSSGMWHKSEYFSIQKKSPGEAEESGSLLGTLQKAVKGAFEKQELLQLHQKKMESAYEMSEYVSNMMKDYFTTDNLMKVVKSKEIKTTEKSSEIENKVEVDPLPKFIEKREKMKDKQLYYSQSAIDSNTKHCMGRLKESQTAASAQFRLEQLNKHLHNFPLSANLANKLKAPKQVLKLAHQYPNLHGLCQEVLGRLGYPESTLKSSPGIRILSIDGGGMKGIMALEILKRLEQKTGKRIYQLFDYMIGVSTGSILIGLLALKKMKVDEVSQIYQEIGAQVFEQNYIKAVKGMVMSQAYYDTLKYEAFLQEFAGEEIMASTVRDPECPKVAFVSAIMSSSRHSVSPFIFRNYAMPYMVTSNFRGSSRYKIWEAVRASSAAPGFFDDFSTKGLVFQDGALIANNPANIGLHEAQHLWPKEKLQTLVSIGMGRYEPLLIDPYEQANDDSNILTLKDKFSKLVLSATDTEMTHVTLHDLLPDNKYFRFNPYLSEIISMDETRAEKISVMRNDSQMYCRRNVRRLDLVSKLTTAQPTYLQRGQRKLRESVENYNYNSLTAAAWEKSTLLASKMTSASNSYFTSLSSVYQAKK